jgi:hypothetical protein
MNGLSIIIPSGSAGNAAACVAAIRTHEKGGRILVIDDGLPADWGINPPMAVLPGWKPFVFARNVNIGICASGTDDVIVLNDDALLETPGGFAALHRAATEFREYGLMSAACNNVGNMNQHPRARGAVAIRDDARMVCFVCVLIPRRTIDTVGLLDERYVDYGMDDDDYSLRVRNAGLKIGIFDGCFVDHSKLASSYRGSTNKAGKGGDFRPNLRRYIEKWGVDNRGCGKETSMFRECFPPPADLAR